MLNIARCGDLFSGVCCCHDGCKGMSGIIITCSPNVITNSKGTARLGDIVIGNCGHTGVIVTGAGTIITNRKPTARITDMVVGCLIGNIVTGSGDSYAE